VSYILTRAAEDDLIQIFVSGAASFGIDQARRYHNKLFTAFAFLAENPHAAQERTEITPPVRVYPVGSHILIYTLQEHNNVLILRVRHAHEDWLR